MSAALVKIAQATHLPLQNALTTNSNRKLCSSEIAPTERGGYKIYCVCVKTGDGSPGVTAP